MQLRIGIAVQTHDPQIQLVGDHGVQCHGGDCRDVLKRYPDNAFDSIVTDPPYGLGFMGKGWDRGVPGVEFWQEFLRVLKPGGHIAAFGGTRTYHRMTCAIEDAGFEIRDALMWLYGSGFPKSHDVSKAIDKAAGIWRGRAGAVKEETVGQVAKGTEYERTDKGEPATPQAAEWQGWGTALKPAWEPICLARKPLSEKTVAANVLRWGTGALNIDGCRVAHASEADRAAATPQGRVTAKSGALAGKSQNEDTERTEFARPDTSKGRWPANVVHDGSDEVVWMFPSTAPAKAGNRGVTGRHDPGQGAEHNRMKEYSASVRGHFDNGGSAARFFYCAKASKADRAGSKHPTVKPIDLIAWVARMITPPGGLVLDPFAGSGTTGAACHREQFRCVLIEQESEYLRDIDRRLKAFQS